MPLWRDSPDGSSSSVSVKQLWEDFTRYPYLPRLLRRSVLEDAIKQGVADTAWSTDGFAYADGHDGERYVGLRAAEQLLSIAPSGLVVHPIAAQRQFDTERPTGDAAAAADRALEPGTAASVRVPAPQPSPQPTRYYGRITLASDLWTRVTDDIAEAVVQPLTRTEGAEVKITIEVEAAATDGFDESVQSDVAANTATLKFDASEFDA